MDFHWFLSCSTSDNVQYLGSSIARQRFNGRRREKAFCFDLLALEIVEVGVSFLLADEDDTMVAVIEDLLEICYVDSIKEEVKGCQALTIWMTVPLTVLDDTVFAFVIDEGEVASTHASV